MTISGSPWPAAKFSKGHAGQVDSNEEGLNLQTVDGSELRLTTKDDDYPWLIPLFIGF